VTGDALARLHPHLALNIVGQPHGARDNEIHRLVVAEQKRSALATDKLRGDTEYRVEQILCSTVVRDVQGSLSCVPGLRAQA